MYLIYSLLNISFDSWRGESYYSDKMDAIVDEINAKGLLKDSEGAKIVDLSEHNLGACLIKKNTKTLRKKLEGMGYKYHNAVKYMGHNYDNLKESHRAYGGD